MRCGSDSFLERSGGKDFLPMKTQTGVLAVIPARSGSKGLPGKNIRSFVGLPLLAHSILFAGLCPEIDRIVLSTDASEIAEIGQQYGAEVPFLRPSELAQDHTPLWSVLKHALAEVEKNGDHYQYLLLLDPTSPARLPEDIRGSLERLLSAESFDGVIGVSQPGFNPIWHCVVEQEGLMVDLFSEGSKINCRQDVPTVYRINGSLYLWRTEFLRRTQDNWREKGQHAIFEIPELRAMSIDDLQEFQRAEVLVKEGLISFPWLMKEQVRVWRK